MGQANHDASDGPPQTGRGTAPSSASEKRDCPLSAKQGGQSAASERPQQGESPRRPFKVAFIIALTGERRVVMVDPGDPPDGHDGLPNSLLRIALAARVPIDHACGGVCACATCHVIVRQGLETCSPPGDQEEDQLDEAVGVTRQSRLACRTVPSGAADLVVEIPAWNRNLAGEGR